MNERERNLRIAETVRRDRRWENQTFQAGQFVALLDGRVVAVEATPAAAVAALRALDPDPSRGMVVTTTPGQVDIIREARG
jgi:hypothetical protein